MKAAVLEKVGDKFVIQNVQIATPLGREVLIDVKASGLCHSDLHIAENDFGFPMPSILGHEIAGIVSAIGPDVTEVAVGDHVVGQLISYCGHCDSCIAGKTVECTQPTTTQRGADEPARLSRDGVVLTQFSDLAGFAEQVLAHENNVVKVNTAIPFDKAALLGCSVITGAGAVINTAQVRVGDTVAIIGCGGVGLNAIQGAVLAGARRVIAIDLQQGKLELAKKFGATDVINPADGGDVLAQVQAITGAGGVDHAFEVIGLKSTALQAIQILDKGGDAYLIGMQKPGTVLDIDPMADLLMSQKSIHGVYMGSSNAKLDIPLYADLYLQGRFNLDDLVSQTIPLEEINEGYEELRKGGVARSVIVF
jgi:S-(hydroxymethyl)glutathione dehydrogenase/alcohol dehydrogenase